jgi:hypothetical protein
MSLYIGSCYTNGCLAKVRRGGDLENGKWRMENGEWGMGSGEWADNHRFFFTNYTV